MSEYIKNGKFLPCVGAIKKLDFPYLDNIELTVDFKKCLQPFSEKALSRFCLYTTFFSENSIYEEKSGEILQDSKENWQSQKLKSIAVGSVLKNLNRGSKILECGATLDFGIDSKNNKKLIRAMFCKDRLCPACQKRRSLVAYHNLLKICTIASSQKAVDYCLLTLTVPNVQADELSFKLDHMLKSFRRLTQQKPFKNAVFGFFRSLEITYNAKSDTYHPHFHVLLCVSKFYFKSRYYLDRDKWLAMWQKATAQSEITQVDIRKVRKNSRNSSPIESAVAEIAKYSTKPADYIKKLSTGDFEANFEVVNILSDVLTRKRLIAMGGNLKEIAKNIADFENLIEIDDGEDFEIVSRKLFFWRTGQKNYIG